MARGGKLKIKNKGPSKQKYSNQRREKAKITSKEATTYIVQLLRKKQKTRYFPSAHFPGAI